MYHRVTTEHLDLDSMPDAEREQTIRRLLRAYTDRHGLTIARQPHPAAWVLRRANLAAERALNATRAEIEASIELHREVPWNETP